MQSTTQRTRRNRLGTSTLMARLKRTPRIAGCGLLLAASACDSAISEPDQTTMTQGAPVSASLSFGHLASDDEVVEFLDRHNVSVAAIYMYSAGLHGTDYLAAGQNAAAAVAQARAHAEEDARSGMYAALSELATLAQQEQRESSPEQQRLVATFAMQRELERRSRSNAPLIWGVEVQGSERDVTAARADGLVKESEVSIPSDQFRVRRVMPPAEFAEDQELPQPSATEIRARVGALAESATSSQISGISAAAAPANGSYYPNSGKIIYTGAKYFAAQFRWDKPSFSNVRGVGVEIDLQISIERGWPFVFNPGSAPCTTWTDLPRPYDDCPTAGVDDDPGWVTYSLGSYDARAIQPGKTYLGSWTFRGSQMGAYWAMRVRGQEVYNKLCPSFTGRGYSPWCMFVYNGRSRDLTAGVITLNRRWTYSW